MKAIANHFTMKLRWKNDVPHLSVKNQVGILPSNYHLYPYTVTRLNKTRHPYSMKDTTWLMYYELLRVWRKLK